MQEIKVGDLVIFSIKKSMPAKTGQVVQIDGDKADVYVMNEVKVYKVALERLKKL